MHMKDIPMKQADLPLVTIDGQDYTGGGFGNEESCTLELTPGDAPVAVVQFSAQPIEGNYVEGAVYKQVRSSSSKQTECL